MFEKNYKSYFPPQENEPSVLSMVLVSLLGIFTFVVLLAVFG